MEEIKKIDKDISLRNACITYWVKDISQDEVLNEFIFLKGLKYIVIGNIEQTENELEHFHVYVEFKTPTKFSVLKNISNTSHIEKRLGSRYQAYQYAIKEGVFFSTFSYSDEITVDDDLAEMVIDDINNNEKLWTICRKYPKFAFYNIKNIKLLKEIHDLDE